MSKAHERVVEAQFGPRAKAYVESAVHSQGADLEAIGALAQNAQLALDLGAGGGHVSYALARHARRVIASDLSSEMLAAVARTAREKGLGNIETVEAPAEHLPFSSEVSFDSNNKEAAAQVPEAERRFRPSFPANYEKLVIADYAWIAGERAKMRERWVSWLTA